MPVEAGHGIELAYEADPTGSPGTFTVVGELVSDLPDELTRPWSDITAHNHTINRGISGVLMRSAWAITVNYNHGDTSHVGLRSHLTGQVAFGMRLRGPGVTTSADEIIVSGELVSWSRANPVREGVRAGQGSFQPSGPMSIDGVIVGV